MQITLTQVEIEQAITSYITEHVNVKSNKKIIIDLRATRGADGTTAIIDIVDIDIKVPMKAVPTAATEATTPSEKPVEEAPQKSLFARVSE